MLVRVVLRLLPRSHGAHLRGIAWAVVRSIATSLWVAVVLMSLVWVFIAESDAEHVALWPLIPLVGAVGMALAMEIKSRDLEKPVP